MQLADTNKDLFDRGVNLRALGAKLDGETDDYEVVMDALRTYGHIVLPPNTSLATSKTIILNRGQSLIGLSNNVRRSDSCIIKWVGEEDNLAAVIQVGANRVGREPSIDSSNIWLKNVRVDCDNRAGFGIYGTYLVNETVIDNVAAENSLEYNMYFARGWYATLRNLTSLQCRGKGIALGMPLELLDGTVFEWTTFAPLELNNVVSNNIRSIRAGGYYRIDNPNTFDPYKPEHRRQGYGIGAGIGNGFRLENFLAEGSGGANLYIYTYSQPQKTIRNGYLENAADNSGLDPATSLPNMIIEHTHDTGEAYIIEDIFMNYNSGGVYFVGKGRRVWLKNVHQPRFLKSLSAHSMNELYSIVLKDGVYYQAGQYNTLEDLGETIAYETVNTRYSWTVDVMPSSHFRMIYFKGAGTAPIGTYIVEDENGNTSSHAFPPNLTTSEWTIGRVISKSTKAVKKGGGTSELNSDVHIKIISLPRTDI